MSDNKTIQQMRSDLLIIYNAISDGVVLKCPMLEKMIFELNEEIKKVERLQHVMAKPRDAYRARLKLVA